MLALGVSALAAPPPVIRKAPEITFVEPSGKQIQLAAYKGKVVVCTFIYTTCVHCQRETQMLTKIYKDMAPRGLQVVGIAFNDNAPVLVNDFIRQFAVPYPVGTASQQNVLNYLGFSLMDRYVVPQVMVIDRKGNIRAQSPVDGDEKLQTDDYMRNLIDTLLKEPAGTTSKAAPKTAAAVQ